MPETPVIRKFDTLYHAFYRKIWNEEISLRGLGDIPYKIMIFVNNDHYTLSVPVW